MLEDWLSIKSNCFNKPLMKGPMLNKKYYISITYTAIELSPTLLVNKVNWSYHKVALDLWGSRIWLNVSIFYQFHKAKSRYLSSEPGHWFKKQLSKFSWNQSKDLTFAQIFAFCDLNVIFDNSNWIECVYILKFQIGVNSKAGHETHRNW